MTSPIKTMKYMVLTPLLTVVCGTAFAQSGETESPAEYTAEQAERGEALYMQNCATCHGENLNDGEFGAPLTGLPFGVRWSGIVAADLHERLRDTMPPGRTGQFSSQDYVDIIAYILQRNNVLAGDELPNDPMQLASLYIPGVAGITDRQALLRRGGPDGVFSQDVVLPEWPLPPNPLDSLMDVSDELLINPPEDSWLHWRGSYTALGYSSLDQINQDNVDELRIAWTLSLPGGPNEATPLVHDGVMFIHSFGDNIMALNALNGDELWHYRRDLPEDSPPRVQRNIALYEDKVYAGTSDGHVIALNMRTGRLIWETDLETRISGGPLVAQGVVMQGTHRGGGGVNATFVQGLDAETGEKLWRFYSIPRPGELGDNTWNNQPFEERSGGTIWTSGSYDPVNNLAFFGPAPTYDTAALLTPVGEPGVNNDALFTNTTLALRPETGELVWYFQHMNNDQFDFDWSFERMITDLEVDGEERRVVLTSGKQGVYDAMDAETGEYLFSYDMGLQNFIIGVDPETGRKIVDMDLYPDDGERKLVCPHAGGGRSWIPGAYNPETQKMYAPAVETCMDMIPTENGSLSSGYRWALRPVENSDGRYGHLQAIDVDATMEEAWTARQRAPQTTGVLATAGGLVFAGALDRNLTAYNDMTGEALWKVRLNDVPNSTPITFELDGKQYIAMVVGYGGAQSASFPSLTPEIRLPSTQSSTVWVFALPED